MVDVSDDHGPGSDGHPLVGVPVDDVDVLVALGRQDHGKLAAVGCEDLSKEKYYFYTLDLLGM